MNRLLDPASASPLIAACGGYNNEDPVVPNSFAA